MSAVVVDRQRLVLSSGSIEALKWLALAAMLVDHVNAVFFARELGTWATVTGRVAMPLFAIVLGYNLARPRVLGPALDRLALVGLVSMPFHAWLFAHAGGWWPLNILLTFAVAAAVIFLVELGTSVSRGWAVLLFLVGGALVEYWWPGIWLVMVSYGVARYGWNGYRMGVAIVAALGLCVINGNAWALLALPIVAGVQAWSPHVPRSGRFFLWFYPAHLAAIAAASVLLQ